MKWMDGWMMDGSRNNSILERDTLWEVALCKGLL